MRGGLILAAALALAASLAAPAALAQPGASATAAAAPGSAQRRAILDALRPAVEAQLGPNVEFVVREITVRQGWAVVSADPQRRGGRRIDPRQYFGAHYTSSDGLNVSAVMRFNAGRWLVVEHVIGASDVWYCESHIWPAHVARRFGC